MVENLLDAEGPEVLPITLIDGVLVKQGGYPSNTEIANWFGITEDTIAACCRASGKGCGSCGGCGGQHES